MRREHRPGHFLAGTQVKQDNLDEAAVQKINTIWYEASSCGPTFDRFLWRGSPGPIMVQRVGLAICGLMFLAPGFMLVYVTTAEVASSHGHAWPLLLLLLFAIPWLRFGFRIFWNAFRH